MFRSIIFLAAGLAGVSAGAAIVTQAAGALAGVAGGQWELDGLPGHKSAVKQCVARPTDLATVEHKGAKCATTILGDQGSSVKLSYQCGAAGFGQATIKVITPRSLRIEVQGISDGAPYGYVLQAHHAGPCEGSKPERGH